MEPTAREPEPEPHLLYLPPRQVTVWPVFAGFVALWLGSIVTVALIATVAAVLRTASDPTLAINVDTVALIAGQLAAEPAFLLASSLTVSTWCLLLPILALWSSGSPVRHQLRLRPLAIAGAGPVYGLFVLAALAVSQVASSLIGLAGLEKSGALGEVSRIVSALSDRWYAVALLLLGVLAPIGEEVFFRGWVQARLARRWGVWPAIAVSALLFGALHADPVHSLAAFGIGLLLGWMVEAAASLKPAIVAHVANNLIWLLSVRFSSADATPTAEGHATLLLVCSAIGAIAVTAARRRLAPLRVDSAGTLH